MKKDSGQAGMKKSEKKRGQLYAAPLFLFAYTFYRIMWMVPVQLSTVTV